MLEQSTVIVATRKSLASVVLDLATRIPRKLVRLARLGWTRCLGRQHLRVRLKSGLWFDLRPHDHLGLGIYNRETFEASLREIILGHVQPGMVVLDIGANIGYYSVLLSHKVGPQGRVIAFEPNPNMLAELRHNLAINNITNVRVEPIALSNRAGELTFYLPPAGFEGHGSLAPNRSFSVAGNITVAARPLDDVLKDAGVSHVDVIKMDVEGAELLVCQGAARLLSGPRKPIIFFEAEEHLCAPFGHRVYHLLSLLENAGFAVTQIEYGQWIARPDVPRTPGEPASRGAGA